MSRRIYILHIQPSKLVLDHADYTAPTRQHELDRTDHTDQEFTYLYALKSVDHEVGTDDLQMISPRCAALL